MLMFDIVLFKCGLKLKIYSVFEVLALCVAVQTRDAKNYAVLFG